jgi:hypothetical protein
VDAERDLSRAEPWRESLERSRARRGKPTPSAIESNRSRPGRGIAHAELAHASATYWPLRWRAIAKRSRMLAVSSAGIVLLALLAATLPSGFDGRGGQASATATRAAAFRRPAGSPYADSGGVAPGSRAAGVRVTSSCQAVAGSNGYVNPLAGARVTRERIDQGVDYAGTGTLAAIGAARVTYLATSNTGWPGAFIEYQLLGGPDAGCYVFYAEGVIPAPGVRVGDTVRAGQAIATIIPGWPHGIELGWGAGISTKTYAAKMGEWSPREDAYNVASTAGKSFSALIASLGGPPGKLEG